MILCQRHLFDLPEEVAYFNCAYMSPLLNSAVAAGREAAARKAQPWRITTPDFFSGPERARELFARLIGAAAGDIALVPAASYGLSVAAANLKPPAGSRILLLQDQFPSNVYVWRKLATERAADLLTVARPPDGDWTQAILAALDDSVSLLALPHCHWTDGGLIDLARIGGRAREVGAELVLDLTQSAGALPFDVRDVQPAFAVAATYKWLLGPYYCGFLYVSPRYQDGRPIEFNWIARAGSQDFARLVDYREDLQPGARRFDVGEGANFGLLPVATVALEQLNAWGVPAIQASLRGLTDRIAERAQELQLRAAPRDLRAGHFLGLRLPQGGASDLARRLAAENVHVSVRGDAMRVTPHLYNNDADIDRLFGALHRAL
ncbi:MAG: aminotransferase class V-fold PLP-dependent enzyme [Alphaproteobacteria bacterium]|nr:aminotransferase class V-fold PLP-dependent enzyme [Alphaproteobacteria bacterium]